ncbi:MAG: ATP-dependent helicase HrpB [Myxococcaceae bacterium]
MAIQGIASTGLSQVTGSSAKPGGFQDAMKRAATKQNGAAKPQGAAPSHQATAARINQFQQAKPANGAGALQKTAQVQKVEAKSPAQMLERISNAQKQMDQILKLAQSGKTFTPAELLSLQAQVYSASQELDLAGKVVEKATGGVKQVLQTQV